MVWIFDKIDRDGEYAFDINQDYFEHKLFLDKMLSYSTMTWADVKKQTHDGGKSKNHYYPFDDISNVAQKRLLALGLEERSDDIFSFAFTSSLRIVGYRENEKFYVLWYDPKHNIYPVSKKHT